MRAGTAAVGAVFTVVTVLAGSVQPVGAAPPVETTGGWEDFGCAPVREAGKAVAFRGSLVADGPDVYLAVWEPGGDPTTDPPVLQSDESRSVDGVLWENGVVSGAVPMVHLGTGEPAGEAMVWAELTAAGRAETWTDRGRDRDWHNRRVHHTVSVQPATVTASVVLPDGGQFDYSGCEGTFTTVRTWTTDPDASVQRLDPAAFFECSAAHPSGQTVSIGVEAGPESTIWIERRQPGEDDPWLVGFSLEATLTRTSVQSSVALFTPPDSEPAGVALLEASLGRSGQRRFVLTHQDGKKTMVVEELVVEGTVSFPDGTVFPFTGCSGERNTSHEILTDPAGPKPGENAPPNDEPAGAIALTSDRVRTDQSRGASPAAEVPLWCHDDPPYPEEQTGSTLWYTVAGTGGAMTVDTAGSSFNTVVGVYARKGDSLVEIVCVDDLFGETLQARATFTAQPGEEYLVQVGGYAAQFGNLRVALR